MNPRDPNFDMARFHAGETEAMHQATEAAAPHVWRLAWQGFVVDGDPPTRVHPIRNPDVLEDLVCDIMRQALSATARKKIEQPEGLLPWATECAQAHILRHAEHVGGLSTEAEGPKDSATQNSGAPDSDQPQAPTGQDGDAEACAHAFSEAQKCLDARSQRLLVLRWGEGHSRQEAAREFTCGVQAVRMREDRVRRRLQKALKKRWPAQHFGPARVDTLLEKAFGRDQPASMTWERLKLRIVCGIHPEEPRPFATRLMWALGAAAFALGLWALMFFDVLPYYDDDTHPSPEVALRCMPSCSPGTQTHIEVLAPKGARNVGIALRKGRDDLEAWLVDPKGSSIHLPFGSHAKRVAIPYPVTIPDTGGQNPWSLVAVFSEEELNRAEILAEASGHHATPGALTLSVPIQVVP